MTLFSDPYVEGRNKKSLVTTCLFAILFWFDLDSPDSMGDRWNLNFVRKCIRINKTRSKFRLFKRFETEMAHLVSLLRLLSYVRIRLLLEPLRSRFDEFSISSYTYQYSSKTKTRQNGFVMALERTADNIKETTQTIWETIWVSFISNLFILKTEFRTCFVYSHVFSNKTQII